jgi:sterol desaturase/sphingolipid hydroxylase (fatty acid hydroxylase superfamily)
MNEESLVRLGAFFGIFAVMALWEIAAPMRARAFGRGGRWATNWGMSIINTGVTALMKIGLGAAAVIAADHAQSESIGLFQHLDWPLWLEVLVVFAVLDFAIWIQHLISHKIPVLWRLHRVHHADRDFDVTTAIRFHPIEIALSMLFKIGLVYALGAPVIAVIIFEVVLNGAAMFNHANIKLPRSVDSWLRLAIVTPDMHRVHHSIDRTEHDANYGFNLSIWDRIFGTYVAQPKGGHDGMTIGLKEYQTPAPVKLLWALSFPFRK